MFQEEKRSYTGIAVSIVVLVAVAAAAFFVFYKKNNHPEGSVVVKVVRTEVVPLHVKYGHEQGYGEDRSEDATYLVSVVELDNVSDIPFFVKGIAATMTTDQGQVEMTAYDSLKLPRVIDDFPNLKPVVASLGVEPLRQESKLEPHATMRGYIILQYSATPDVWQKRQSATLQIDGYNNTFYKAEFPK